MAGGVGQAGAEGPELVAGSDNVQGSAVELSLRVSIRRNLLLLVEVHRHNSQNIPVDKSPL